MVYFILGVLNNRGWEGAIFGGEDYALKPYTLPSFLVSSAGFGQNFGQSGKTFHSLDNGYPPIVTILLLHKLMCEDTHTYLCIKRLVHLFRGWGRLLLGVSVSNMFKALRLEEYRNLSGNFHHAPSLDSMAGESLSPLKTSPKP